jgi:hypothetical protein
MQTNRFLRTLACLAAACLAACSPADNPYASIKDPPLVRATLHTLTLVGADAGLADRLRQDGFVAMPQAPNYPGGVRVEAALWKVPEDVAAAPVVFMAPGGRGTHVRLLNAPARGNAPAANPRVIDDFYRKVLGTGVPEWPGSLSLPPAARIHAWTFLIDDVLAAKRRLREAGIPVTFDAVAITTAYLGDHKLLGITAPDGVIIELVETAAH